MNAAKLSPVTPSVVSWAVSEDGRPLPQIAESLNVAPDQLVEWTSGESAPTAGQLSDLARILDRPRALFFLPRPPDVATLSPRFRHPPDSDRDVSPGARRKIRQAQRVQQVVSWAREDAAALDFLRWVNGESAEAAAARLRAWLNVSEAEQAAWSKDLEALREWRTALDERGVLVFALDIGTDDIRGFSAWDERAPLVVLNTSRVSPAARSFTLAHELGHLVRRQDSACVDLDMGKGAPAGIERWCEEFAACFLMPRQAVNQFASERRIAREGATIDDVTAMMRRFRVSARASALRLKDIGYASAALYPAVVALFKPAVPKPGARISSPSRPVARLRQYGPTTVAAVIDALPPRDALSVLRITVEDAREIAAEIGGIRVP
jgi:Zn-dependent peptidase ImmA (M78 family)